MYLFQSIIQWDCALDLESWKRNIDFSIVDILENARDVRGRQFVFQSPQAVSLIWQHDHHAEIAVFVGKHQNLSIQIAVLSIQKFLRDVHHVHIHLVVVVQVERLLLGVRLMELVGPISLEINRIHEYETRVFAQRISRDQIFNFLVGFLFNPSVDGFGSVRTIAKVHLLNFRVERRPCDRTEVCFQLEAGLGVNFIRNVQSEILHVVQRLHDTGVTGGGRFSVGYFEGVGEAFRRCPCGPLVGQGEHGVGADGGEDEVLMFLRQHLV